MTKEMVLLLFSKNKLCVCNSHNRIILKQEMIQRDIIKEVNCDLRVLYSTQNNMEVSK